jgi:alkylmercury lyase
MVADVSLETGPAIEIRPGVFRPDWSAVVTTRAREALAGRITARAGLLDKWAVRLGSAEDLLWRTILRLYVDLGRPPALVEIAASAGIDTDVVAVLLGVLRSRDLIGLDPHGGGIGLAYPFTQAATGHSVELKGRTLHALCAIDALGVGAMYETDVTVSSSCRHCGSLIRVKTTREGRQLEDVVPSKAVVWYDFAYDGSAAASCCPAITFFCSGEHLDQWRRDQRTQRVGIDLAMAEALEVGRAIFGPVLIER